MGILDKLKKSRNKGVASNTDPIQEKINAEIKEADKNYENLKGENATRYQSVYGKAIQMDIKSTKTAIEVLDSFDSEKKENTTLSKDVAIKFKESIIRKLKDSLLIAENLGIENVDTYMELLNMLESIQIQDKVSEKLESILKKAMKIVNEFGDEINKFVYEGEQQVEAQDETRYGQIKENGQKETQNNNKVKPNEISRTGSLEIQEQRDKDYYDSMHEERRKTMKKWSENQKTQGKVTLKNKDQIKTDLEKEDENIDKMLRQKWDRMLGL